jgi:hypothetical protein
LHTLELQYFRIACLGIAILQNCMPWNCNTSELLTLDLQYLGIGAPCTAARGPSQ